MAYITNVVLEVAIQRSYRDYIPSINNRTSSPQHRIYDMIRWYPNELLGMLGYLGYAATSLKNLELIFHKVCHPLQMGLEYWLKNMEKDLPGQINGIHKLKRLEIALSRLLRGEEEKLLVRSFETCARTIAAQGGWTYLESSTQRLPPEQPCGHKGRWVIRR